MLRRLLSLPIQAPWTVIVGISLITAFLGFYGARIRVDSAIENLLPEKSAERTYYDGVRKTFGSEEATVIGMFADDIFSPYHLATIDRLSRELAKIDGVREVISLTTIKGVETDEFGLRVGKLMRELPTSEAAARAYRDKVLANPLYVGSIVSADAKAAAIIVAFDLLSDEQFLDMRIEQHIHDAVDATVTDAEFAISGIQTLKVMGAQLMEQDLVRFVPLSILLVVVVLIWSFRTVRGVLLPLASVLIGVTWTVGVMVLSGRDITMGTLVLPPLLMAIGIAYAIHIVSRYYHEIRPGRSRVEIAEATLEHSRLPVSIAALTTLIGFATLILNPIRAISEFGIFSVFGIATIFLMSILLLPALLVLLPDARRRPADEREGSWVSRLLEGLGYFAIEHRWLVIIGSVVICALSLWAARSIRVETDYLSFFDPHGPVRAANTRIAEHLGGTQPIYVVIDGPGPRSLATLPVIDAIRDLQHFIREQPGVDSTLSFADFVSLIHKALNPDSKLPLPASQSELAQLLTFASPEDLAPVVTKDYSRANILVRTRLSGSAEFNELVHHIEDYARRRFSRDIGVHATGSVVLLNQSADTLSHNQVLGLFQVLIVLSVLMSLLFLSVRAGLLSLVPNVVPIIILFGIMGVCGISLNISTSMIAVIAIGIAIDDTIHYLTEFNAQIRKTGEQRSAVMHVGREVGRPIVFTSIALFFGFLIVCWSNFKPIQHFGFLAGTTMLVALLADLLLLPALVMSTTIITLWDLLYVKLGPQPHKEIPLFQGLRPFQAKLVVLMAQLASAEEGEAITRRGELKAELYVLLSGVVEVRPKEGEPVIRTMSRGDVIGEMGLVRARPRSADVTVRERTEYLVLDGGFLSRIQRRYPRIAATVFLNLTRILSDRLETTTDALAGR